MCCPFFTGTLFNERTAINAGVVQRLWGFGKVRYCGLRKNATRAFTALALANILSVAKG